MNQAVWVSAVYLLTFAVPLLVTGRLGDRFGQRNVYLVGMTIFVVSATACAFAPTIEFLIVARAVQGLGASLLNPQPLSVINRPTHRAPRAFHTFVMLWRTNGVVKAIRRTPRVDQVRLVRGGGGTFS